MMNALCLLFVFGPVSLAAPVPPSGLVVDPPSVSLAGSDASTQVVLSAKNPSGLILDLIPGAKFQIDTPAIAKITAKAVGAVLALPPRKRAPYC